jgi:chemotaxis protein histidine kinase CheA
MTKGARRRTGYEAFFMSVNKAKNMPSSLYEIADEYRADTIARLAKVSVALEELAVPSAIPGARRDDPIDKIRSYAHTIKGSLNIFGFSDFSVVVYA